MHVAGKRGTEAPRLVLRQSGLRRYIPCRSHANYSRFTPLQEGSRQVARLGQRRPAWDGVALLVVAQKKSAGPKAPR
jgi:hypothetical protein